MFVLEKHWLAMELLPSLWNQLTACGQPRITLRRQKITLINQVPLAIIWLRLWFIPMWRHFLFGLTLIRHFYDYFAECEIGV